MTRHIKYRIFNVVVTLILVAMTLESCYSAMPINEPNTSKENNVSVKTVIVYYDSVIGTDVIEAFIKKHDIEVLYRYSNIKGYALKLQNDKQRKALETTKGVLSVQDDQVMQLQQDINNAESNTHLPPRRQCSDILCLWH